MHDNIEFEQLFAAYSNRELTREESSRLYELAGKDVGRRGALAEMEAVQELMGVEVEMRKIVQRPVEPAEEVDESYQRLAAAAVRAETKLRATMEHPAMIQTLVEHRHPTRRSTAVIWGAVLAAAAILVVSLPFLFGPSSSPGLDGTRPDPGKVLGLADIHTATVISAASSKLSWDAPEGAVRYDAILVDGANSEVLRRPSTSLRVHRSTVWDLTTEELAICRQHEGLFLQVVARDKRGVEVARTLRKKLVELR